MHPETWIPQKGASCGALANTLLAALGFQTVPELPASASPALHAPLRPPSPRLPALAPPGAPRPESANGCAACPTLPAFGCEHHSVTSTRKTWEEQRLSILRGSLCKQSGQNKVNKQRSTDNSICNNCINLKPRMLTPVVEYADTHSQGLPGFTTQPLSRDFRLGSWHCASAAVFGADARSAGVKASLAVDSVARLRVAAGVQRLVFPCFCHLQDF